MTATVHEPGAFQHAEVLGDRGQGHMERLGEGRDGRFTVGEAGQERAAGRVRQRGEGGVEAAEVILNHMVKYIPPGGPVKRPQLLKKNPPPPPPNRGLTTLL